MKKAVASVTLCFAIMVAATVSGRDQDPGLKDATHSRYKVGQVWSYKTRPIEKKSTFVVLKVEHHPKLGNIVHIALRDIKLRNPRGGYIETARHLPFAEEAINRSAIKLLKEREDLPDYDEGYRMWRESFDAGTAGIYTITIAEAVDVMEAALNQ